MSQKTLGILRDLRNHWKSPNQWQLYGISEICLIFRGAQKQLGTSKASKTSKRRLLVKLPGTSQPGALHMRLNLSGFSPLLFLPLLLRLFLLLCLPLLLLQGGGETMGELGNEVFVEGVEGEQASRK